MPVWSGIGIQQVEQIGITLRCCSMVWARKYLKESSWLLPSITSIVLYYMTRTQSWGGLQKAVRRRTRARRLMYVIATRSKIFNTSWSYDKMRWGRTDLKGLTWSNNSRVLQTSCVVYQPINHCGLLLKCPKICRHNVSNPTKHWKRHVFADANITF